MARGGDIVEITCSHPTEGQKVFFPKSNEDSQFDPGGVRTQDDANNIDGSGEAIDKMNRARWSFEGNVVWDMEDTNRSEIEYLRAVAGSPLPGTWSFQHINQTVYSGLGKPVGDIIGNGADAMIPIKISGGGLMDKQG